MVKKYLAILLCMGMGYGLWAQKAGPEKLVGPTWLLIEEIVSGNGKQPATDKDIHLDFAKDGKWQATHPLHGANQGTWQRDSNGKLVMTLSGKKHAEIVVSDDNRLEIVFASNQGTVRWKWETAK